MTITAAQLRERLAGTCKPLDPLDVVVPKGTYSWPAGMMDKIASTLKPAGVLIPVRRHEAGLTVLLTQRSADLNHHAGQVSFPGGTSEPGETEEAFRVHGRKVDDEAAITLSKRLKVVNLFRAQRQWEEVQYTARESLVGRMYSRALLSRVQQVLKK